MGANAMTGFTADGQREAPGRARPRAGVMRCGRCRHEYAADAWRRLAVVERMLTGRIRTLVTSWPDGIAIEIRRCGSCGAPIARKEEEPPLAPVVAPVVTTRA